MQPDIETWKNELVRAARPDKVDILSRFFKTAPGEYGEGDVFVGVTVPLNRSIAQKHSHLPLSDIASMLASEIHEYRLSALLALVHRYKKTKDPEIIEFYITYSHRCNNWDLVDLSAPYLIGEEITAGRHTDTLHALSTSSDLWKRRIAVVSTLTPVRRGQLDIALSQCRSHLTDHEPLMQKAVGWVLREVGKKSETTLLSFLHENIRNISSTTLSYATERVPKEIRQSLRLLRRNIHQL